MNTFFRGASILAATAALAHGSPALAESADYYRGGWRTDAGAREVFEFVIRGSEVSGIYCTYCSDGTTLARIEGTFDEATGISFSLRHLDLAGSLVSEDLMTAKLAGGRLIVTGTRGANGEAVELTAIKDPRGPAPGRTPQVMLPPGSPPIPAREPTGAVRPAPSDYIQPAPWRQLSAEDALGVWLGFGTGMIKQYFFIRRDGDGLFGLACGPCDNPYTMGALENFHIEGDTIEFDIVHEDWGEAPRVPFTRHVTAHIGMNELRMDARRDDGPEAPGIVASLVGPLSIEATRGNRIGE